MLTWWTCGCLMFGSIVPMRAGRAERHLVRSVRAVLKAGVGMRRHAGAVRVAYWFDSVAAGGEAGVRAEEFVADGDAFLVDEGQRVAAAHRRSCRP